MVFKRLLKALQKQSENSNPKKNGLLFFFCKKICFFKFRSLSCANKDMLLITIVRQLPETVVLVEPI